MRPGMPGSQDRLIGRHDEGGYGGGWVICPIFDSRAPEKDKVFSNFSYDVEKFDTGDESPLAAPPEIEPFDVELGTVRVLFVPGLLHYSLETHYKNSPDDWDFDNWRRLVERLGVDPRKPQTVHHALRRLLVPVLLQKAGWQIPNPREDMVEVKMTTASQAIPFESIGQIVPHLGRLGDKRKNLRQLRILQERTSRPLSQRLRQD